MPPKQDFQQVQRDLNFMQLPLRIILLNFAFLNETYDKLKAEHRLADFPKEAIPLLMHESWETSGQPPTFLNFCQIT